MCTGDTYKIGCEYLFIGKKDERGVVLPFFFVTSYIDFAGMNSI